MTHGLVVQIALVQLRAGSAAAASQDALVWVLLMKATLVCIQEYTHLLGGYCYPGIM